MARGRELQRGRREGAGGRGQRARPRNGANARPGAARPRRSHERISRRSTRTIYKRQWEPGRRVAARMSAVRWTRRRRRACAISSAGMLAAFPDLHFEVLNTTTEDQRCGGVRSAIERGTFAGPAHFNGVAPTGDQVGLEGLDLLTVRDGLIQANDAFADSMTLRAPDRDDAAAGIRGRAAADGTFNVEARPHAEPRRGRGQASRPACGSCRAGRGVATCS